MTCNEHPRAHCDSQRAHPEPGSGDCFSCLTATSRPSSEKFAGTMRTVFTYRADVEVRNILKMSEVERAVAHADFRRAFHTTAKAPFTKSIHFRAALARCSVAQTEASCEVAGYGQGALSQPLHERVLLHGQGRAPHSLSDRPPMPPAV